MILKLLPIAKEHGLPVAVFDYYGPAEMLQKFFVLAVKVDEVIVIDGIIDDPEPLFGQLIGKIGILFIFIGKIVNGFLTIQIVQANDVLIVKFLGNPVAFGNFLNAALQLFDQGVFGFQQAVGNRHGCWLCLIDRLDMFGTEKRLLSKVQIGKADCIRVLLEKFQICLDLMHAVGAFQIIGNVEADSGVLRSCLVAFKQGFNVQALKSAS